MLPLDRLDRSLRAFLERESRKGARDGFVSSIKRWAARPQWTKACSDLQLAERIPVLIELGHRAFDEDFARCRTHLERGARRVEHMGNPRQRRELLREHCAFLFVSLLDPLTLFDDRARLDAFRQVELRGEKYPDAAMAAGQGLVFLGCHQTHSGFAFRHPHFARWKFTAVRNPSETEGRPPQWAEGCYGPALEFVPATLSGAERLRAALAERRCIALQNDFCYPGTVGVPGSLFGRPVVVSRSLVKLILRSRAPVVPVSIVRLEPFESRRILVEFFPPLPMDDLTEAKSNQSRAGLRLSIATECLIRRYPVQWVHWSLLEHRWSEAQSAWPQLA